MRRHINATTAKARNKGLEGAAPGTSASLIYTDHKGRKLEGRQNYPVRVYADGTYVGVLNPGETMENFSAQRVDEVPMMEEGTQVPAEQEDPIEKKTIDYSQYTSIPQTHFDMPEGDFDFSYKKWTGEKDNEGSRIYETVNTVGTHDPNWYTPDFDPYEYYKPGEDGEYDDATKHLIRSYEQSPYMGQDEYDNARMIHPLTWNEEQLVEENRNRFNQSIINNIWDKDGNLKPEYENQLGEKRYLRPFGTNFEDAPNNQQKEGRWSSEWFEGSVSGWGKPGNDESWRYDEEAGTWKTFMPAADGEQHGKQVELDEKGLKKLYKTYKKSPGFGDISKKEFIERYKSGDIFHPQIAGVDQEKNWIQTFEDKVQPFKQGEFDAQKAFFDGAISSDLYREKLIAQGYENVDDIILQREEALSNASMQYESTAQNYADEYVSTAGGDGTGYRKGNEGEFDVHQNRLFSILDKRGIIHDLIKSGQIDENSIESSAEWRQVMGMYNDYTPFGDEAPPTEHGFFDDAERDALFYAQFANKGINMSDFLNDKLYKGKTGARAYVASKDGKTIVSPRQAQQINIDHGGDGSTKQLHSSLDEISAHELGHMSGAVPASENIPYGLNENDQKTIERLMDESGVDRSELNWHDGAAYERKADLDSLRWKMYNTIGYDYRTTPMTNEILQEYKNYIKKNPSPSLVNDRNFKFFKDDKLIEFNNTVADATNEIGGDDLSTSAQVRSGGPAKYNHGSDVQIQEPNLDIQANTLNQDKPKEESIFTQEELDYVDFINNRKPYRDEFTLGDDAELFFLELYNTELTADELLEYYVWRNTLSQRRSILNNTTPEEELTRLDMDRGAYDIQGFWKSGDYKNTDSDGHGSDKWKKPNHVTFSNESKYAKNYELPEGEEDNRSEYEGGLWNSDGGYVPSEHNMYGNERLHREFNNEDRPEYLYMGNQFIYSHPEFGMNFRSDSIPSFFNQAPTTYQDGTDVKIDSSDIMQPSTSLFIPEPNTVEMDEKFTKMYRDQDEGLLEDLTFDGTTEAGMIDYLKFTENGIAAGYKKNKDGEMRWYPHKDNKGIWTIGYGHNIGAAGGTKADYKDGLTDQEVEDLLKSDMKVHTNLLEKNVPEWENLSTLQRNALLDIQYNIRGNVWTKFPSFTKAVVNKDWKNVVIHGSRAEYKNKPNQRNTAFYKSMIEPMVNEWRPEIRDPNAPLINPEFLKQNRYVAEQDNTRVGNNAFGGWEEGSEVTHPEVDPPSDDFTYFLNDRTNEYALKYPNYSDKDIYEFYLNNKNPDDGTLNVMNPEVRVRSNSSAISPVPFYSTHFSTTLDTPNLFKPTGEKCVAYGRIEEGCAGGLQLSMEFNTNLSKNGVRNVNGLSGSAWEMHANTVNAGGQSLFNYSDYMNTDWIRRNPNEATPNYLLNDYNRARTQLQDHKLLESTLQTGDFVDLFYSGSSYQGEAITNGKGSNVNSHVGKITEKNGKLYVTHNVNGTWFSDPLENMLENQRMGNGHRVMVVGGYRPKYETGLVDGVSIHPENRDEVNLKSGMYTGWDGEVASDYLNNLGLVMPDVQQDFNLSDSDAVLVAEASYGTFGAESTFAEGGRYTQKSWGREFLRGWKNLDNEREEMTWTGPLTVVPRMALNLLSKDFREGTLEMDDYSEGMTQIKHRAFMGNEYVAKLFEYYGIDDPDTLYTAAGASRGTALVHTMNLDLINNLFAEHDLQPQTKKNMLYKAYNAGIDNVLISFVDEEQGIITPSSFENGRKIYAERHLDKNSMTYLPNQLNKLVSFDFSKLKQGKKEIENYTLETMSGFETMFHDSSEQLEYYKNKLEEKVDEKVDKGSKKYYRGLKKIERFMDRGYKTKKEKYLKKANALMDELLQGIESTGDKVKDKSKRINTQVQSETDKAKNIFNKIKNKVSSNF